MAPRNLPTGRVDRLISASNAKSLGTSTGSLGAVNSVWYLPQRNVRFNASYLRRLRCPRFRQVRAIRDRLFESHPQRSFAPRSLSACDLDLEQRDLASVQGSVGWKCEPQPIDRAGAITRCQDVSNSGLRSEPLRAGSYARVDSYKRIGLFL